MLDALIVGTGRCGTGFMSKVLTRAGFLCSHEGVYNPSGYHPPPLDLRGESSWLAVPHLGTAQRNATVLIVREPAQVVRSMLGIEFWQRPSVYRSYAYEHLPGLMTLSALDAAWAFWTAWNTIALEFADLVVRVDDPDWGAVGNLLDIPVDKLHVSAQRVGYGYNARRRQDFRTDDVSEHLLEGATALWEQLA